MRAPALVQQFTHLIGVFQSLPSLIENSPHLSYLLGKIANKKKRLENTNYTGKNIHLLLLPLLRWSRNLFASSGLCVGKSCCFVVVYPGVCLKQNSGTLLNETCATDVKTPSRLA